MSFLQEMSGDAFPYCMTKWLMRQKNLITFDRNGHASNYLVYTKIEILLAEIKQVNKQYILISPFNPSFNDSTFWALFTSFKAFYISPVTNNLFNSVTVFLCTNYFFVG